MNFYQSIAPYYDHIFPVNPKLISFIEEELHDISGGILDVGCATGGLLTALAHLRRPLTGIDLDKEMIEAAQKRTEDVNFLAANMLDLDDLFHENEFALVLSTGNTVVHLDSPKTIGMFFKSIRRVTRQGGTFICQIVNYDRIMAQKLTELPTIENDAIRFGRHYSHGPKAITFQTELLVKAEDRVIENAIDLYPLQSEEIFALLQEAGFSEIETYGAFNRIPWDRDESFPLIVVAR